MSDEPCICRNCGFPIHPADPVRYLGDHVTHSHSRCIELLRMEVDALRADAERARWGIKHAAWLRHEHTAYVAIPVAIDADLSCVATRTAAIDKAMKGGR